ncbi:MAG: InlB B-repeat-containing protein [Burkholderiales bacterium]|jgi:hypothetical protein|nr:InlB B-repeat-containing protein [Burkholderiales bacterium]
MIPRFSLFGVFLYLVLALPFAGTALAQSSFDATYYVSASGSDANDGLSESTPFATLAKTAGAINGMGSGGNYLVVVTSDLTSTANARYYNNSVTITSLGAAPFTVTRGTGFSTLSDPARGYYNPAMLEIGSTTLTVPPAPPISLTLENIIFDDAYLHEAAATKFGYAPTPANAADPGTNYVQDGIVASYANNATIVLSAGAELRNFGGMTAIRATHGAGVVMNSGSLITDIGANANTRAVSTSTTNYYANGEAAIAVAGYTASTGSLFMYEGSRIANIANAHGIKFNGPIACFMDGEIDHMIGHKGMGTDPGAGGRGFKSAMLFDQSPTFDTTNPSAQIPGAAVIGPNANIHDNVTKSGTVAINRSTAVVVKIYGKVNNNTGGTGTTTVGSFQISAGTNGGGLYIVNGGTIYLEEGSEIIGNSVASPAYGGAASIQQNGSVLIMNGGTVSGNRASGSATSAVAGIVVSKGNARFEMNGGTIANGNNGLRLYESGSDGTAGKLILNAGTVSGVTVDAAIPYGYLTQRHLFIDESQVAIGTGYASVAGRQVAPISAGFYIGNPNAASYTNIRSALPQGWAMPTTDGNVIGFWVQKNGTAIFSVPVPTTGAPPTGYDRPLGVYFAAVQEVNANGSPNAADPVKLYPTQIVGGRIVVTLPIGAYPNGVTVALVQPTTAYGIIDFDAQATLFYNAGATNYTIPYTASYQIPEGLRAELVTDGHSNANTVFTLTVRPDSRTVPVGTSLTLASDIFEIDGSPVWNAGAGEWVVKLKLKDGWGNATNLTSSFGFNATMVAANFREDEFLSLTGDLAIAGQGKSYLVYGDEAKTEMKRPLAITYTITYDANGGSGAMVNGSVASGGNYIIAANAFTYTDHAFTGWNTAAAGNGATYAAGAAINHVQSDITLYAQWRNIRDTTAAAAPIPTTGGGALVVLGMLLAGLALSGIRRQRSGAAK